MLTKALKEALSGDIVDFQGEHRFLSNFFPVRETTAEHLFQAAKTEDVEWKEKIMLAPSPGAAKRLGRLSPIRIEWDETKVGAMREILKWKFSDPVLREKLLSTNNRFLIEGNMWHDNFWGICFCVSCARTDVEGENQLGKLLMDLRTEITLEGLKSV